jgi:hypothetical protein
MSKRALKIEEPGEVPAVQTEASEPATDSAPPVEASTAAPTDSPPEGATTQPDPEPAPVTADPAVAVTSTPTDDLPNEWEIDPATIPHGQTRLSKQGLVCSTAEDPRRLSAAAKLLGQA